MRRTKIIHFPLVSCVGRGALLLEGVMRSGIVSHFSMTSLIGDLGPSYKLPSKILLILHMTSTMHSFSQTKMQIITLHAQKSPPEWSSLLSVCTWGYWPSTWSMLGEGRGSSSGRDGADLKPQGQGSASAGRERGEGGRDWLRAEGMRAKLATFGAEVLWISW